MLLILIYVSFIYNPTEEPAQKTPFCQDGDLPHHDLLHHNTIRDHVDRPAAEGQCLGHIGQGH